ncbi:MAG: hypothetical protein ABIO79_17300 [Ferruginibacter sp.]
MKKNIISTLVSIILTVFAHAQTVPDYGNNPKAAYQLNTRGFF